MKEALRPIFKRLAEHVRIGGHLGCDDGGTLVDIIREQEEKISALDKKLAGARAEIERMKNCENCAQEKYDQPPCAPWGKCKGAPGLDISGWQPRPAPDEEVEG